MSTTQLRRIALFAIACSGCDSDDVATVSSTHGDDRSEAKDAAGPEDHAPAESDAAVGAGGSAGSGGSLVDVAPTPTATPPVVTQYPPLPDVPLTANPTTDWYVDTASRSILTSVWAWPIDEGRVGRATPITPAGELWEIPLRASSADGRRYAFVGRTVDAGGDCQGHVVEPGADGPKLRQRCYALGAGVDQPRRLLWLDDAAILVAFSEADHEEEERTQWFVDELTDESTVPILPSLASVSALAPSPDGRRFLVSAGRPEPLAISLVERGAESVGVTLRAGSRFLAGPGFEQDVRWAPNSKAVVVRDSEALQHRLFVLDGTPREIDLGGLGPGLSNNHVLTEDSLFFVDVVTGAQPKLKKFDWRGEGLQATDADAGAPSAVEIALPSGVIGLAPLRWAAASSTLFGVATLSESGSSRSTLVRVPISAEGANAALLMDHPGREILPPLYLAADGALFAGSRPTDDLSAISLVRWPEGGADPTYFGPQHAPYEELKAHFPAHDASQFVLQLQDPNHQELLVWYRGDSAQALPLVERTQEVHWLPDDAGVLVRSTSGLLWSDFRSGAPEAFVDIGPEY